MTAIPIDERRRLRAHALTGNFDRLLDDLASGEVYRCGSRPAPPKRPGVYLFAEGDQTMHVGRTRNLQKRRQEQTSPGGDRYVATFAFLLARTRAMELYEDLPSIRQALGADTRFVALFTEARAAVRAMDFRCVVIEGDTEQALFEIFASVSLGASYNFWKTH